MDDMKDIPDFEEDRLGAHVLALLGSHGPMTYSDFEEAGINSKSAAHVTARLTVTKGADEFTLPLIARLENENMDIEFNLTAEGRKVAHSDLVPPLEDMRRLA